MSKILIGADPEIFREASWCVRLGTWPDSWRQGQPPQGAERRCPSGMVWPWSSTSTLQALKPNSSAMWIMC